MYRKDGLNKMSDSSAHNLQHVLARRFSDAPMVDDTVANDVLLSMATRGSCRKFLNKPVPDSLLNVLCATALASPTKSDLQQRDIIAMKSPEKRRKLAELVAGQAWVAEAPLLLVFCGNNRRQRLMHEWSRVPFANDHLDAFFNAATDAAVALGAFVTAAESAGLGCCPISAVRNEAAAVSDLLSLPQHVFPFAGLAVGYPSETPPLSSRLPLQVTCHTDAYTEEGLQDSIRSYEQSRTASQPYAAQRFTEDFGTAEDYGWSDDKVRQYSRPERADFGAFVRSKGFRLD